MTSATTDYSILVVDDDPDIVLGLQDFLDHHGYRVDVAYTCAEAVTAARARHYDAVILDLSLPDGDGFAVLRTLQELDPRLPVVILTAFTTTERTVGSLSEGAFAYLTKPYNRDELIAILTRAVGVHELATKVQSVEHALSESEERFRSLVESATDAIVLADEDGLIVSWNQAARRLFGYTEAEVRGKPLTIIMPERYRAHHERGFQRVRTTGQSRLIGNLIAVEGLRKNGTEFPLELSLATWKSGGQSFYSGIIRDITERRRSEVALDRLRRQHALILTQAGEGIYGLDADGNTTFVNTAAAALLGYEADELLGRSMHQTLHHTKADGAPYPAERCPIHGAIHDGRVHRVTDEVFWKKDGTSFPVEYVSTPIREDHRVVGVVVVFRDISDRKRAESALSESEERFRQLAEHINEVFWITDPAKSEIIYISPGYEQIWGRSCASLYAAPQSWLEAVHPDDRPLVLEDALNKQVSGGYDKQYRIQRPDGSMRWIWDRAFPIRNASGSVYRIVGFAEDITDRKRAALALEDAEQRFRSLVANIPGAVYRCACDADWTMRFLSEAMQNICGYPASDFIDNLVRSYASIIHLDDRLHVQEVIGKALLDRQPYQLEYRILTAQNGIRWVSENGQGIFGANGRLLWLDGVIFDITDRKLAEKSLQESEARYRALFEDNPSMYLMVDGAGVVLSVNRFGSERLGYKVEELIGRPVFEIFHDADRSAVRSSLEACLASPGVPMSWELRKVRKNRSVIWVRETAQAVLNERGDPVVLIVCEDVSAMKDAERAARESEDFTNQILRSSADCIKVLDLESRIQFMNQAGMELMGITDPTTLTNRLWMDFWEGEDRAAASAAIAAAKAGEIGKFVGCCPTADGQRKWWDVQITPMHDGQHRLRQLLVTSRDITEYRRVQGALQLSEERLELVIHGSNDGFWDGRMLPNEPWYSPQTPIWWSPHVREMLGVTEGEFPDVLESWLSRLHPEDKEHTFAALEAHIERRIPYDQEYRLLAKQGDYRWFRARGQGVWDESGRLIRMAGSLQCITDRKRFEEALRQSEELLRSIISNSTAVVYAKDADGRYLLVNSRFEQLFSISFDRLRGKTDHDIFPKEFADAFRANDLLVLKTGQACEYEEFAPHPDGLHAYISVKVPLVDHQGRVYASCGISTDITERKRAEEQLRMSEERLRMALSASHVGIWDWDIRTGRMYWSAGVEALCGLATGSFAGTYAAYMELVYLEDRGALLASVQRALTDRAAIEATHRVMWPDGTLHWLAWTGRIHRDSENRAVRVLGTVSDVTGRDVRNL
ncbi:MAG: PAS domain S-box protein [Nitrospiraceae bacterium]